MTAFSELQPDGTVTNVRVIKQSDMLACPHVIMVPEHYRDDGTCRCDDQGHTEMVTWGYTWDGQGWRVNNNSICRSCGGEIFVTEWADESDDGTITWSHREEGCDDPTPATPVYQVGPYGRDPYR